MVDVTVDPNSSISQTESEAVELISASETMLLMKGLEKEMCSPVMVTTDELETFIDESLMRQQ